MVHGTDDSILVMVSSTARIQEFFIGICYHCIHPQYWLALRSCLHSPSAIIHI